jgi:hypothetical protein
MKFYQDKNYPERILSEEMLNECINYLLTNREYWEDITQLVSFQLTPQVPVKGDFLKTLKYNKTFAVLNVYKEGPKHILEIRRMFGEFSTLRILWDHRKTKVYKIIKNAEIFSQ